MLMVLSHVCRTSTAVAIQTPVKRSLIVRHISYYQSEKPGVYRLYWCAFWCGDGWRKWPKMSSQLCHMFLKRRPSSVFACHSFSLYLSLSVSVFVSICFCSSVCLCLPLTLSLSPPLSFSGSLSVCAAADVAYSFLPGERKVFRCSGDSSSQNSFCHQCQAYTYGKTSQRY